MIGDLIMTVMMGGAAYACVKLGGDALNAKKNVTAAFCAAGLLASGVNTLDHAFHTVVGRPAPVACAPATPAQR